VNTVAGEYEKMKPLKDVPLLHSCSARRKCMNNIGQVGYDKKLLKQAEIV
jgi:hypothetical protein